MEPPHLLGSLVALQTSGAEVAGSNPASRTMLLIRCRTCVIMEKSQVIDGNLPLRQKIVSIFNIVQSQFKSKIGIHDFFVYGSGKNSRIRPDPAKSLGSVFATQVYLHRVKVEIIIQPWYIYLHIHQLYTTADNYTVYTPPATMAHDIHSPPQPPISPISAFVFFF